MEKRNDGGATWRRMITPKLEELGYDVFNPCLEECDIVENYGFTSDDLKSLNKGRNIKILQDLGKDIVLRDLKAISNCDVMIVYYDKSVNESSGTLSEMTIVRLLNMRRRKKQVPVYAIQRVSYKQIPVWTIGCIDEFFGSLNECTNYMKLKESIKIGKEKIKEKKNEGK